MANIKIFIMHKFQILICLLAFDKGQSLPLQDWSTEGAEIEKVSGKIENFG